ncbi:helix-turn-helix domain-containing protein [Agromyces sp. NPDC056379]|uniref:AraC family transcriptional regulator n=1 Tax=unclassified Agromyces TaxID=2639701 RepID=UPI0035DBEEC8
MGPHHDGDARGRPIGADERTGVLHPSNLARYAARWLDPDPAIRDVVDQYWHVRWALSAGESIDQRIVTIPAVTLTVEEGDVPAPLVITGAQSAVWARRIIGSGDVFAIRLRPAGLAVLGAVPAAGIVDAAVPVTRELDARLHSLLRAVERERGAELRAQAADRAITGYLRQHPIDADGRLANAVVDELTTRLRTRTGQDLADRLGASERAIQRALQRTVGLGPKRTSRLVRLQEVARALASADPPDLAALAAELGYVDQAHLHHDFQDVAGISPGAYTRSLRALE